MFRGSPNCQQTSHVLLCSGSRFLGYARNDNVPGLVVEARLPTARPPALPDPKRITGDAYLASSISQAMPSMIFVPLTRLFMPTDSLVPWVKLSMGSSSGWEPVNP